jgi:prepilin-type N-terminal cleavage/methylation domain-containing protein
MIGNLPFKICDLRGPSRARARGAAISSQSAFTLVEMLVTVTLLAIIVLGLAAMFGQTRRAFTSSMAQVDVLEAGRGTADMISRDVEQMVPAYLGLPYTNVPNFSVVTGSYYGQVSGYPLVEQLANPADAWTNIIQELFFLTPAPPINDQWNAVGYRLQITDEQNSIGSLYRYYVSINTSNTPQNNTNFAVAYKNFIQPNTTTFYGQANWNRIIDGVTYFRVLAYEPNGNLITNAITSDIQARSGFYSRYDYDCIFYSNALPAYVEVELGVMETQAYQKYLSFGAGTAAANTYLTGHPGVIHIFRQRIPIRAVDPTTAFP